MSPLAMFIAAGGCGIVAGGILVTAILSLRLRRPLTPRDAYCSAVDDELTEAEYAARAARAKAALQTVGADADRVSWAWADRTDYAPFGDPEFMPGRGRVA